MTAISQRSRDEFSDADALFFQLTAKSSRKFVMNLIWLTLLSPRGVACYELVSFRLQLIA